MDLHAPWALLAGLAAGLVALAALVAWFSGREATGIGPAPRGARGLVRRRAFLALPLAALPVAARAGALAYPEVVPGYRLEFPRDHGAHPAFRLEWWYVTGWLEAAGEPLGFQVTFFRARPRLRHRQPERVRAAPDHRRARGARRSAQRASCARRARRRARRSGSREPRKARRASG
ncbi:MAG: lipocalin-like domain-containing protein [Burkholderiales bacterium]|nr:lipocalin-like domain-containing protein [Burkholderiales bacterium]